MNTNSKYAIVTTITLYRTRYAVPVEDNDLKTVEHLKAMVTDDRVDEFSQLYLNEQIIDARVVDEQQMLEMFDVENEYLKGWSTEQKIDFVKKSLIIG